MRRILSKIKSGLATLLVGTISITSFAGCGQNENYVASDIETMAGTVDIDQIVSDITETLEDQAVFSSNPEELSEYGKTLFISEDSGKYVEDTETFVYGAMMKKLEYCADVFPAYVELSDGNVVSGIGYADFEECYTNEEGTEKYVLSGFIPCYGELDVPNEDFDEGLIIRDMDYDGDINFVWAYKSDPFTKHCVVNGNYVKYGVDESGKVFYTEEEFQQDKCDTSIGSIYSFDEGKYLYDANVGNYEYVSAESLNAIIDYREVEKQIAEVLKTQDINYSSVDVEQCAYFSQKAVVEYFLSMQEETFLGYDVDELVAIANDLDPMECLRLTQDGLEVINLQKVGESAAVKWIVGAVCVVVVAVSVAGSILAAACPPLSMACGALAGFSIEIFMQVIVENEQLVTLDWRQVVVATSIGAVGGLLGPYVSALNESKVALFLVDSSLDGFLGAIEQGVYAWLDGKNIEEIAESAEFGFLLGFGISAGFKVVSGMIGKSINGVMNSKVGKNVKQLMSILKEHKAKFVGKITATSANDNNVIESLQKKIDGSIFHSDYLANKQAMKYVTKNDRTKKKAFDALKKEGILDNNGTPISKKQLEDIYEKAKDKEVIGYFIQNGEKVNIVKENGMVGIYFDKKYQTIELDFFLTDNRDYNYKRAMKIIKDSWDKDETLIPDSVKKELLKKEKNINELTCDEILNGIKDGGYVLHENTDLKSITIVAKEIHDKTESGISHAGGVSLAKELKLQHGKVVYEHFARTVSTNAILIWE